MPKAGARDLEKERHWREVIADWHASGLSIAHYCRQRGLVVWQFSDWRKRLKKRDAEPIAQQRHRLRVDAKRKSQTTTREKAPKRKVDFAELQVVERVPATIESAQLGLKHALEIIFPSRIKLRLDADCPLELLSSVVSLLEGRHV